MGDIARHCQPSGTPLTEGNERVPLALRALARLLVAERPLDALQLEVAEVSRVALERALTSPSTIDHAIGVLMAPRGRSADDAFQILVRASQRENRTLREIAADLLECAQRRKLPPPPA